MLLGTLGDSLLQNLLTGNGKIRSSEGTIKLVETPLHPLTNLFQN